MNSKYPKISLLQLVIVNLVWVFMFCGIALGASGPLSVALYYAPNPPVNELKAFDVVVVDPDSGLTPARYGSGPSQLFAYVSVGEAEPNRSYFKQFEPAWLIGDNHAWKSRVVDVSSPAWREFFLDKVIEPLWQAGYRGFFLDTLDSYQLATKKVDLPRMEAGLAATVLAIRERHPDARLILNRGFEIFDRVKGAAFAVAAESLYRNFSPATGKYGEVSAADRQWLTERLNGVKKAGIPVIAIDYVPPGKRDLARLTAEKIKSLGFTPWVTDKDLAGLGVGTVEVMPRTVLALYDGDEAQDPVYSEIHRFVDMPLNYLGYHVQLHDMRFTLPQEILSGRYAGIVAWPFAERSGEKQQLRQWIQRALSENVPVVFLGRFGITLDPALCKLMGLSLATPPKITAPLKIVYQDKRMNYEEQALPQLASFVPLTLTTGDSLLRIKSANGYVSDAVAITPWGGYALQPFVNSEVFRDRSAWILNPFSFFKDALRLPDMPVPDTTTENGTRLLLVHIDGDGFESMAEWPGGRLSATELRERVLKKYRIPTSVSIITGITAPKGLYPQKSAEFEKEARFILELPWVEAASHSFSHPFVWQKLSNESSESGYNLNIPGYKFSIKEEIEGSIRDIDRLLPAGKKTRLFFWTGDCTPDAEAIEATYRLGVGNINSGDTLITESNRSITNISPLGINKNGWFQIYAPNQNENVYTNNWTGPFYGYQRVIETFRMTDKPRRFKPVNIYYHFYSASKESSLNALRRVYDWAQGQRLFSIFTSEYVEKVLDFNRTVIARDGSGWLVRNSGSLRELRIPAALGYPDLAAGSDVAGFTDHGDSRYLHLAPGGNARLQLQINPPAEPYLKSAGGFLDSVERNHDGIKWSFSGYTPFTVRVGNAGGCRVAEGARPSGNSSGNELTVDLTEGKHALAIDCRK